MMVPLPPRHRRRQRRLFGLHQVEFHGVNLRVTVTKRAAEVDQWVSEVVHNNRLVLHNLIVGLDIEWHPCLVGEHNPVATLQLCVGKTCLIFQLLHRDYTPHSLIAFLANPQFTFVGVGVGDDAQKLRLDHGLVVGRRGGLPFGAVYEDGVEENGVGSCGNGDGEAIRKIGIKLFVSLQRVTGTGIPFSC
nr:Werner Syndrome-like exonuclease [Ipomoea batatas]